MENKKIFNFGLMASFAFSSVLLNLTFIGWVSFMVWALLIVIAAINVASFQTKRIFDDASVIIILVCTICLPLTMFIGGLFFITTKIYNYGKGN